MTGQLPPEHMTTPAERTSISRPARPARARGTPKKSTLRPESRATAVSSAPASTGPAFAELRVPSHAAASSDFESGRIRTRCDS